MRLKEGETVVFFGDSITRGFFGSNYITILKRLFCDSSIVYECEFVNAGRDGDMIDDLLSRVEEDVLSLSPDWVIVLIGINDVFYESIMLANLEKAEPAKRGFRLQRMAQQFRDNYAGLIDMIREVTPNIAICTTTAIEDELSLAIQERLSLLNNAIRSLAVEKGCFLIDINHAFADRRSILKEQGQDSQFQLTIDGVHLNKYGAEVVARTMFEFFMDGSLID